MNVDDIVARTQEVIWETHGERVMIGQRGPYLALREEDAISLEAMQASSYYLVFKANSGVQASPNEVITFLESGNIAACVVPSFRANYKVVVQYEPIPN
ncbi:hypothetical protein ACGRH2_03470 [Vibrio barjaei]|uniref:Uncharacterized protein n=1 Tax=Vibrio barjaei TaxID=1676683 RepID=A0ABW7ID27_9VIBR